MLAEIVGPPLPITITTTHKNPPTEALGERKINEYNLLGIDSPRSKLRGIID